MCNYTIVVSRIDISCGTNLGNVTSLDAWKLYCIRGRTAFSVIGHSTSQWFSVDPLIEERASLVVTHQHQIFEAKFCPYKYTE